jgi:hypothetical protein
MFDPKTLSKIEADMRFLWGTVGNVPFTVQLKNGIFHALHQPCFPSALFDTEYELTSDHREEFACHRICPLFRGGNLNL